MHKFNTQKRANGDATDVPDNKHKLSANLVFLRRGGWLK